MDRIGRFLAAALGVAALGLAGFSFWRYWIDGVGLDSWAPWAAIAWEWERVPEFLSWTAGWPGSIVWIAAAVFGVGYAIGREERRH